VVNASYSSGWGIPRAGLKLERVLRLGILRVAKVARAAHPLVGCQGWSMPIILRWGILIGIIHMAEPAPGTLKRSAAQWPPLAAENRPATQPVGLGLRSEERFHHCRCDAKGEILTFGFALVLLNLRLRPPPRSSFGEEGENGCRVLAK